MTTRTSEQDVARFLSEHPAFFLQHPDLFTEMQLPDPHQGNAVSLHERQCLILRERVKALETRLAELLRIGRDNDRLAHDMDSWTAALLAHADRGGAAAAAIAEIRRVFGVPLAELRLWSDPPAPADAVLAQWASTMQLPRCGTDLDLWAINALGETWTAARSVALIPLRPAAGAAAFGLIALGSDDPGRFAAELGTAVLTRIGVLATAALRPVSA